MHTIEPMSPQARDKFLAKTQALDEYFVYLRELAKTPKEMFLADYHIFGAAERFLQLTIEALFDLGKMIIVENQLSRPESNQQILNILKENSVISDELFKRLDGIASFRNILVHGYEKLNRERVYIELQNGFPDLEELQKALISKIDL
jgi:uncharacterized protein YutE (UPF0331/DUF86 family)